MIKIFNSDDINQLERIYRINLINALSGFKSVNLIGTKSKTGQPNVAVFSSVIHMGSNPPLMGFIMRPLPNQRDTYPNLKSTGFYTINHVTEAIYKKAHQTSAKYEKGVSEFEACGLTEEYHEDFAAPFVKECAVKMGLSYVEEYPIKANNTILIIGKIEKVIVPESILKDTGHLNIHESNSLTMSGLDTYFKTEKLERMPYAHKPKLS